MLSCLSNPLPQLKNTFALKQGQGQRLQKVESSRGEMSTLGPTSMTLKNAAQASNITKTYLAHLSVCFAG